jgi:hypothetical protein
MKNNMIIGAALFIISLSNSVAQDAPSVNASVAKSFEKSFSGATNLRWSSHPKSILLARFTYQDKTCLAYFNRSGQIISTGHKVSVQELPAAVGYGMNLAKENNEKKYGPLAIGMIYEMVTESEKAFFVPLVNDKIQLLISVAPDGTVVLKRKTNGTAEQRTGSAIARKQ